ncbi:MAG: glycosyltransferase family 39 protein [Candidatus Omnitrophica bacterium]|nr:glycosyltransferase family 39 protein [Candidatus Omnitrophota bacterium]
MWDFKPPLFFLTASASLCFGINKVNMVMSNLLYFTILLFATYGIGRKLYSHKAGLLGAFLVSMFPTIFAFSRVLMTDFSLTAMVTLTYYLFLLNNFKSLKFALLTGLIIGLGSLTKQAYFIFFIPALAYFFLQKENLKSLTTLRNFVFTLILGLAIASTFYIDFSFKDPLYSFHLLQCQSNPNPYFYLQNILDRQLLSVFSLLFLISALWAFKQKRYLLIIATLLLLLIFSLSPNKQDRFILPIFPCIAVIISGFILSLPKFRKTIVTALILFSLLQYFIISYGNRIPAFESYFEHSLPGLQNSSISESGLFFIVDESRYYDLAQEIIKTVADDPAAKHSGRKIKVLLITQDWKINSPLKYLKISKKLPMKILQSEDDFFYLTPGKPKIIDYNRLVLWPDFIVIEDIPPENLLPYARELNKSFKQHQSKFQFVKTILFTSDASIADDKEEPDLDPSQEENIAQSKVHIYKNICLKN